MIMNDNKQAWDLSDLVIALSGDPSEEVQLKYIKRTGAAFGYIAEPTEKAIELHQFLWRL